MKLPLIKFASLIGIVSLTTTACAQPNEGATSNRTTSQSVEKVEVSDTMGQSLDSHLRQVLTQAGIKTQITSIAPSNLPNMYQVSLAGQAPLYITKDGKYVIQGKLQKNPSKQVVTKTLPRSNKEQIGQPVSEAIKSAMLANMSALKNMSTKTPLFYTAVPGVIWGATLEGVPFLLSNDAQYITDGEISVIENGQFVGLDTEFEQRKNQSVLASLDDKQLIHSPATSTEKAVIYVADDVNCPYCRRLH